VGEKLHVNIDTCGFYYYLQIRLEAMFYPRELNLGDIIYVFASLYRT